MLAGFGNVHINVCGAGLTFGVTWNPYLAIYVVLCSQRGVVIEKEFVIDKFHARPEILTGKLGYRDRGYQSSIIQIVVADPPVLL